MPHHSIHNERPESQDRMIKLFQRMGFEYISRADAEKMRVSKKRVLFEDVLKDFLLSQTYTHGDREIQFPLDSVQKAINVLDMPLMNGLFKSNKGIYDLICSGQSIEQTLPNGGLQSFDMQFINFDEPSRNTFQVTDEFEVERTNGKFARPDIVLLVNGIPLVVIECKSSQVDVKEGIKQNIRNWHPDYIPQLFKYVQVVVAANPNEAKYGTCGTPEQFFVSWKEDDKQWLKEQFDMCNMDVDMVEQDRLQISMLSKNRLLDIIKNFIVYDNNVKKIARYKQYYAVKKSVARIKGEDGKSQQGGVVWHTQGSGKTLTMVMLVKAIKKDKTIKNPRFLMVSDRKNLDKQMRDNFVNTSMKPTRASTGKGLVSLLRNESETVITTTIHKFTTAMRQRFVYESDRLFVFVDEGHRSQTGSLNTYMKTVLPNSIKIAFTGTPLLNGKKTSTYKTFGPLIDAYTIEDANEDKVIVPLVYEGRVIPQKVSSTKIDDYLKYILEPLNESQKEDLKSKWSRFVPLAQTKQRLDIVAFDLYEHFRNYCLRNRFKAMLTCSSRASAVHMYYKLKNLEGVNPAVVITNNPSKEGDDDDDSSQALKDIAAFFKKEVEPLYGNDLESYEDFVKGNFEDEDGDINLLIVKDKLLTGYDAPIAAVLYVDKSMKDHTLLQAIARVNRVYEDKAFGLIVDYYGVFKKLKTALDIYTDAESGMNGFDEEDIKDVIFGPQDEKNKLEFSHKELWDIFKGVDKNESDSNVWQEYLDDKHKERRKDFYDKLRVYSKRVDLMFSSYEIFKIVGYEKADEYRNDLLHFVKLRASVSLRYNDSVDFSQYEDGIIELLNTYVNAEDTKIIVEPLDILDKSKMDEQLKKFGSNKRAKADSMRTRLVAELETSRHDDPAIFLEFSERINKTLEEYMRERNDDAYYNTIERIAEDFREGRSSVRYPHIIENDSDAKSFYADICKILEARSKIDLSEMVRYKLAEISLQIKDRVMEIAKRDWRNSGIVIRKMESALDDVFFDCIDENGFEIDIETIDVMIEDIILIAKKRF